jgi:hypothetical protein
MYSNNKKFSLLGKSSGLIPLASILILVLGILGFVEKGAAPLVRQLGVEMAGECFSFLFSPDFPWSYGPSIVSRIPEVVLPGV